MANRNPVSQLKVLIRAIRSFELADIELRRAELTAEQPRLQRAGDRYALTRYRLFAAPLDP